MKKLILALCIAGGLIGIFITINARRPITSPKLIDSFRIPQANPNLIKWNSAGDILAVEASPYAVMADETSVQLWAADGGLLATLTPPPSAQKVLFVTDIAWHPAKNLVAVAYTDGIRLWSTSGQILWHIDRDQQTVRDIDWDTKTGRLVSATLRNDFFTRLDVWDEDGRHINTIAEHEHIQATQIEAEDNLLSVLLFAPFEGVQLFDIEHNTPLQSIKTAQSEIALAPNNEYIVGVGEHMSFWTAKGEPIRDTPNAFANVQVSRTGDYIAAIHETLLKIFASNGNLVFEIPRKNDVWWLKSMDWHPSKNILAVGTADGTIQLWQLP